MICGALQTLNEEACEDVLEEGVENDTGSYSVTETKELPPE